MKKIKIILLTTFLMHCVLLSNAQETWYEHGVWIYPEEHYNLNSVIIRDIFGGLICGDSGIIAERTIPCEDNWQGTVITDKNLNSIFNNIYDPAFIVGDSGKIFKSDNPFPGTGYPVFYSQYSPTIRNLYSVYFTDNVNGIAVGDTGTIIRTTDGGNLWNIISPVTQNSLRSLYFSSNNIGYAVGSGGIVLKTANNGSNWEIKTQPFTDTLRCVWFINDNTGFSVGDNGSIFKTTDGGTNWQSKPSGTIENLNAIRFLTSDSGYAVGNNKTVLKTLDAGETWTIEPIPIGFRQGNYKGIGVSVWGNEITFVGSNGTAVSNVEDPNSINKSMNKLGILITPNPAKDKITISIQNYKNSEDININIFNLQGQMVLQQKIHQIHTKIDISNLEQGVYIIKTELKDGSIKQEKFEVVK